jgi:4-hydroxy-tetrahydrodipicolinate reductase
MLRVIVIGLGPIGINCAKAVQQDRGMKLVGLVDIDPQKSGRSLNEVDVDTKLSRLVLKPVPPARGRAGSFAPKIVSGLDAIHTKADAAIVTTTSYFDQMIPTLRQCMKHRLHVVSSCEQMSFPRFRHKKLADQIDAEAKKAKVALLGSGVNPGFVMDLLPLVLSSMVKKVDGVKVIRKLDAGKRRLPLQAKVGATMSTAQFKKLARQGKIGHQGIGESVAMIAAGLGQTATPSQVKITLQPVIADREMRSLLGTIRRGQVCGMRNTAVWSGKNLRIELDLTMAVGVKDARDQIELSGPTPLRAIIPGSTPGDTATVAALVNCLRLLPGIAPGLKTMLDLPPAASTTSTSASRTD